MAELIFEDSLFGIFLRIPFCCCLLEATCLGLFEDAFSGLDAKETLKETTHVDRLEPVVVVCKPGDSSPIIGEAGPRRTQKLLTGRKTCRIGLGLTWAPLFRGNKHFKGPLETPSSVPVCKENGANLQLDTLLGLLQQTSMEHEKKKSIKDSRVGGPHY